MNLTPNYELQKPLSTDKVLISVINQNMDIIDSIIKELSENGNSLGLQLNTHISNENNPHKTTKSQVGLSNVDNTSDIHKPVSIFQNDAIKEAFENAISYTDESINLLINGAEEELDTLRELAEAFNENKNVLETLNNAIGTKADKIQLNTHITDNEIHVTNEDTVTLASVANKADKDHTHSDYLTAHPNIPQNADSVSELSTVSEDVFNVIDSITRDSNGHIIKINVSKVKMPKIPTKISELQNDSGFVPGGNDKDTIYSFGSTKSSANGNTKINLVAGGSGEGTQQVSINGTGATTVTTDASGNISINSTNTVYTHPTASGNKHIPSGGSDGQILKWSSDGTAAWGTAPSGSALVYQTTEPTGSLALNMVWIG